MPHLCKRVPRVSFRREMLLLCHEFHDQELQLDGVVGTTAHHVAVVAMSREPDAKGDRHNCGNADNYHRNPETLFAENGFHWRKGDKRSTPAAGEQG